MNTIENYGVGSIFSALKKVSQQAGEINPTSLRERALSNENHQLSADNAQLQAENRQLARENQRLSSSNRELTQALRPGDLSSNPATPQTLTAATTASGASEPGAHPSTAEQRSGYGLSYDDRSSTRSLGQYLSIMA